MSERPLRGICVGAGYFSRFHYQAWQRIPEVEIIANVDLSLEKAETMASDFGIKRSITPDGLAALLAAEQPDFIDIITPPATHHELCQLAIHAGTAIICQKPLAPSWEETQALAELIRSGKAPFMVHENWRWQPWYREIKQLIEHDAIGEVFHCAVQTRLGDGWGEDAYLARQPFFRDYPRLFIFETGIHFLDTFRFLFGEVESIYAQTARRNPVIKGEDSALVLCKTQSGVTALLDANRYNESEAEDPRYTFGTARIEGSKGHLELDFDGSISIKPLGKERRKHDYMPSREGFAGDCVFATQQHFTDCLLNRKAFESTLEDYLKSVQLVESAYASADSGVPKIL
ncbi:MAG: Gfo/Idh/MocA family oxidoreductase [Verrucomicrobiota bacterium]